VDHLLPARDRAFLHVLAGEVTIAGRLVTAGQIAWSDPVPGARVSPITLGTADGESPSVIMVYSGAPIGEPVTFGGPFVMNTEAEIAEAFRDFRAGKFGDIPRLARLRDL
jgi:redox-sensitive bicupin YhaK (pirin superfamily)